MKVFLHTQGLSSRVVIRISKSRAQMFRDTEQGPFTFPNKEVAYPQGGGWYTAVGSHDAMQKVFTYVSNRFQAVIDERNRELRELLILAEYGHSSTDFQSEVVHTVTRTSHLPDVLLRSDDNSRMYTRNAKVTTHKHNRHTNERRSPSEGALAALQRKLTRHV